ncbi:hypothetical protein SK3146_03220 [Paenibacillus konkukensis]|uniref:Uncharacterized protein n=2 Tax=Paenibacillus konkukensis TaxID=2020716 RepID=A0ABY4RPC6_9BACL|nr:hypothetical protein SK3146_03220 [Paenibacillus konkukensis]
MTYPCYSNPYPVMYSPYPAWYTRVPMPTTDPGNVEQFQYAAKQLLTPAAEMHQFMNSVAFNPGFAKQIKEAAAQNKIQDVNRLIHTAGIRTPYTVGFNPNGITLQFQPPGPSPCFSIRLALCW